MGDELDFIGLPVEHLSVADLNYMVAALMAVGAKMLGPDFIPQVCATAERLREERDLAASFHLPDS